MAEYWIISALKEVGKFVVTEGLWPPFKRHVDYWWSLGDNIQGLRDEIRFLEREMRDMDQRVEEARRCVDSATADVENWSNKGTLKLEEATRILQGYDDLKVWSIISRYSVGKNAKSTAEGLKKLRNDRNSYRYAYPTPPPSMVSISDEPFMEFESRRQVEEDIMKSLNDDHVHVIAICGAGGVGKTTMARRIVDRVKRENLFDEVVMVVVGQQIEMAKIQKEIAELLGLSFSEITLVGKARKLCTRLLDSTRKLIIFDDVWENFKLDAIGVPLGNCFSKGKIILTSRVKDACKRMNAHKIIPMEMLIEEEAWTLFKEKAGNYVEGSDLLSIGKQIVEECKGLPVSLVTVGKALKDQRIHVWKDSLSQLRRSIPIDFPEVIKEVYNSLKWSYDILDSESMKSIFLLCCLFPEDYNIPIEQLTWYSIGLRILEGIQNIEEGRNKIYSLVDKLKSRYLLISGSCEHYVKMHDVIRDVGIFICSKEKHGWLKSLEASSMDSSSKDSSRNCNWMSIDISIENVKLPVWSDFPNLHLLMILDRKNFFYSKFYEGFDAKVICFRGIKELNVLYFSRLNYRSFPPSLTLLEKLRTLHLVSCEVEDISLVGELASLEILIVHYCGNIKELPVNVGRLNHLRVLELESCRRLKRIAPGVISSLVGLEELKIINCFDKWEPKENQSEERNVGLSELESMPILTCLDIDISNCNLVAQEIHLSKELVRYQIYSRDNVWRHFDEMKHERSIALTLQGDVTVGNWICQLLGSTQSLVLCGDGSTMKKVVNSMDCKFLELEHLVLRNLVELEAIIDGTIPEESNSFQKLESLNLRNLPKLAHLWKSLSQNVSGGNLKSISIVNCPNLRYVLSAAITRSLVQLQHLEILHCDTIESIKFPKLEKLTIGNLPRMNSLVPMDSEPPHDDHSLHFFCNQKVEFPSLRALCLKDLQDIRSNIWCRNIQINFFRYLDYLDILCINRINNLMSSSIAKNLVNLRVLSIGNCPDLVEVIEDEKEVPAVSQFPKLQLLYISRLHNLRSFCQWKHAFELPLLRTIEIDDCPQMETFTLGSLSTPSLPEFWINGKVVEIKDLNAGIHDHFMTKRQEETGNWSTRLRTRKRQRT